MSKMSNLNLEIRESEDYQKGWEIASEGRPFPQWNAELSPSASLTRQRMGWQDYHDSQKVCRNEQ